VVSQEMVTDRPDQTESSSAVNKGSLQIESGLFIGFTEDNLSSKTQILAPTTLFRYGIFSGIELRVLSQLEGLNERDLSENTLGISDLELGTKINLLNNKNINTEIAFISHIILPTGSTRLSNNKTGINSKLSISHELSPRFSLGYNVGYIYFGEGKGDFIYSMALGVVVTKRVGFYLEPFGSLVEFDKHESNFDAGITYLIKNNVQLDFSFGTGINQTMNYLSVGCSINIKKEED
jgi:hypothetical protein